MTHATVRIIRQEHAALAALLRRTANLLARHRAEGTLPDFASLRTLLFKGVSLAVNQNHEKKVELLFPKLRARTPYLAN